MASVLFTLTVPSSVAKGNNAGMNPPDTPLTQ